MNIKLLSILFCIFNENDRLVHAKEGGGGGGERS
jgi:hypothetical protein